ncbi:MAG: hypothetical protein WB791_08185 [Waddliaceae bacterium]
MEKRFGCSEGGTLNHFFLENDWIDEIMLFVQPVALEAGIGIFGNKPIPVKTFTRKQSQELGSGFTLLRYQVYPVGSASAGFKNPPS